MCACARLLLLAALPALAGRSWRAEGEVVSVEAAAAAGAGGAGPRFAAGQRTAAVLAAGETAALDCRVLGLADKSVSWVRSRDLQILAHAGAVFTADARVSTAESRAPARASARASARTASSHTLHIDRLRPADTGQYECQLNTEPKMSLFFNLTVIDEAMPRVVVQAEQRAVAGTAGGAATLACAARYEPAPRALPLPPLQLRWTRGRHRGDALSLQSSRGGISLDTERWAARVVSRLTLAGLRPGDAGDSGDYQCSVGDVSDHVTLLVDNEEQHVEAMQRDQSAGGGAGERAGGGARTPPLLLLAAACAHFLHSIRALGAHPHT